MTLVLEYIKLVYLLTFSSVLIPRRETIARMVLARFLVSPWICNCWGCPGGRRGGRGGACFLWCDTCPSLHRRPAMSGVSGVMVVVVVVVVVVLKY
ncbi:hypothetical protein E2C01_044086 [Portunus trituberculatus]|uniref:Uncharacterized protein n=1 Tax=Portunus trituberculatus TaxID=210409 RepID=A0A5B7FUM7_PORTR|nr:hypothetical protein [Portunus trituberculatus]